jgi:nucleoside-diphosphate-sugar epimerase
MSAAKPSTGCRVVVTGAGGFIGSHLAADCLRRGDRVAAIDLDLNRVAHLESPGSFDLIRGDVSDPKLQQIVCSGADTVFHLAAAHLEVGLGEEEYRRVNIDGTRSLACVAAEAGVRRFVHCSTVGVFGAISDPPANEETPCHPQIAYERTKLAGEQAVLEVAREGGLRAVILRPVWVYGPGCPRTEKLFRAVARGRFVMAGRGEAYRHCLYIRDLLDALQLSRRSEDAVGEVLIVGDGAAVRVRDLLAEIAALVGARPPWSVPCWLLYAAGWMAETAFRLSSKEPPLSRRTLKFFTSNTAFDISRARRLLGYEPRYDLSSGLRECHELLKSGSAPRVPLPDRAG